MWASTGVRGLKVWSPPALSGRWTLCKVFILSVAVRWRWQDCHHGLTVGLFSAINEFLYAKDSQEYLICRYFRHEGVCTRVFQAEVLAPAKAGGGHCPCTGSAGRQGCRQVPGRLCGWQRGNF